MTNIISFDKYLDSRLPLINLYNIVKTIEAPIQHKDFQVRRLQKS